MTKTWLVDLFASKIESYNCDIIAIIVTSAINCGISNKQLYYTFVQGHPISFLELIQIMRRLKRGRGERKMKDKFHILLPLPTFVSVLCSVLSHKDTNERRRQMNKLRTVTRIILQRDKYFKRTTDEYFSNPMVSSSDNCNGCCPVCHGESAQIMKLQFLIDHIEATIFDSGCVSVGVLSSKILERKGSVWVDKAIYISAADCHHLGMVMWVHHILKIHWTDSLIKKNDVKLKKDIVCLFEKKEAEAGIRMNHRDDTCWSKIPHI